MSEAKASGVLGAAGSTGGQTTERVRVVDVRRTIAGAVIEKLTFGAYPVVGDRVLMENTR